MVVSFLQLSEEERREALAVAAGASGRPVHLLEKDVYVVWALEVLFGIAPFAQHLVFKGGTSLSKAYQVIRRFSEDVDITYDIREIVPELIQKAGGPSPPSRSQERVWTKEIRKRLVQCIEKDVVPLIADSASKQSLLVKVRSEDDSVFIEYDPVQGGTGYVAPIVRLDFGARATGEPAEVRPIVCDAAQHLVSLTFPTAEPRVMRAERTFWEKATAIHVFCAQAAFRGGNRFARHWYDVICLDRAGYADKAVEDRQLALDVAEHKRIFFPEKDEEHKAIDYHAAVSGRLQLVPDGKAFELLAEDYRQMVNDRLLLDEAEAFETLIEHCSVIQERVNQNARSRESVASPHL